MVTVVSLNYCYEVCNNAFLSFQKYRGQSETCDQNSRFRSEWDNCFDCVAASLGAESSEFQSFWYPFMQPWFDHVQSYCEELSAQSSPSIGPGITVRPNPAATFRARQATETAVSTGNAPSPSVTQFDLVLCSSRIINPTYTPATPIPSIYLWGCDTGSLCQPPIINCNWELPPNISYICDPIDCGDMPSLPDLQEANWSQSAYTPPEVTPFPPFFFLDPQQFQVDLSLLHPNAPPYSTSSASTAAATSEATSPSSNSDSGSKAWTAGAVIGPLTLIALVVVGIFLLQRRRRNRRHPQTSNATEYYKPQLDGRAIQPDRKELDGKEIKELDGKPKKSVGEIE